MNSVNLIGRLTKEPALLKSQSGKSKLPFTIAIDRTKDVTDFVPCVAWNNTAELIAQYFHKGNQIGVEGLVETYSFDDTNVPNKKVFVTDILVNRITFIDTKDKPQAQPAQQPANTGMNITADDLPF